LPDQKEIIRDTLLRTGHFDLVLLSGGVSMGAFDLVPDAAGDAGFEQVFHKVRIKPGKPVWFGVRESRDGDSGPTLLLGLPGNPVSVLVNAVLFARPALEALATGRFSEPVGMKLPCGGNLVNRRPLVTFTGAVIKNRNGVYHAVPVKTSGSGDILRFSAAQCLIQIPPESEIKTGEMVDIIDFRR
jgi:molybdopterin molybdotransferase